MHRLFIISLLLIKSSLLIAQSNIHHKLNVKVDVQASSIDVTDTLIFKNTDKLKEFYLNTNLSIYHSNSKIEKIKEGKLYNQYRINNYPSNKMVIVKYKGILDHNKESYKAGQGNFSWYTSGIIFNKGISLDGGTYWVPYYPAEGLITFNMTTTLPKDWGVVSQGKMINNQLEGDKQVIKYASENPTNQVCLIGNKWKEYSTNVGKVKIRVFLINHDEGLARKYMGATGGYLRMYESTIGEYPYEKFDVVENFWETGFGMPSFTLLGSKVMRMPWIIGTSYPHELLHNYWGNSVYVDSEGGNWSEGITTYMADYTLKEIKGQGENFRRSSLKKYTDYVNKENDFPVSKFVAKTDKASEAIGYSKVLMMNHMLKEKYGYENFKKAYAHFYKHNRYTHASFTNIKESFEAITGDNLSSFFNQWLNKTGAPVIEAGNIDVKRKKRKYILKFSLKQTQEEDCFNIDVPVYITLDGEQKKEKVKLNINGRENDFSLSFDKKPVRVEIDPHCEIMRRLFSKEVAPTISSLTGSRSWTIIVPSDSPELNSYKALANQWKAGFSRRGKMINVVEDKDIEKLPAKGAVLLMGKNNKFAKENKLIKDYKKKMSEEEFAKLLNSNDEDLLIYTLQNHINPNAALGYLNINNFKTAGMLFSKLMHYGNYSYLGFDSNTLNNKIKGEFPVLESPLSIEIK